MGSEQDARAEIDRLLAAAGWRVQDAKSASINAALGVAIREFPLKDGHGFADYMLYVDGKAAGVLEAKKKGFTLSGVETQSAKYVKGLPDGLPAWHKPRRITRADRRCGPKIACKRRAFAQRYAS